jgi:hypothetical protein
MPRPLTRDAGPTPLDAPPGKEWEQSVGSRYREGMATTIGIGALMASQRAKYCSVWYIFYVVVKIVNLRFRTHIKLVPDQHVGDKLSFQVN